MPFRSCRPTSSCLTVRQSRFPSESDQGLALSIGALNRLQQLIYQRGVMGHPIGQRSLASPAAATNAFLAGVSAANTGRARWDNGWRIIEALPSGQIIAEKAGAVRLLHPGEFATFSAPGFALSVGAVVSAYCPREASGSGQPFYFAFGETVADYQDDLFLARFYWNVRPDWASPLIGRITARLNAFHVPFRMKCLSDPSTYPRRDAAVLYVARRLARTVAEMLVDPYQHIAPGLCPSTPLLTRTLAPGLAYAEDPGNTESFGANRARLVAEAISLAYAAGKQDEADRLYQLQQHFARNNLDLARPHMGPGAHRRDDVPALVSRMDDVAV